MALRALFRSGLRGAEDGVAPSAVLRVALPARATTSVSPSIASTRTSSPGSSGLAARVPDLSPQPHAAERRAADDHLPPLAEQPLGTGRDRVAAQEPDPEGDLSDLDHRRGEDGDHAPRGWEYEQPDDRQREQHPLKDAGLGAMSLSRKLL